MASLRGWGRGVGLSDWALRAEAMTIAPSHPPARRGTVLVVTVGCLLVAIISQNRRLGEK
jgi:hypothetical protein